MELAPVVEALQATLSPQLRKQAEEKLAQVPFFFIFLNFKFPISIFRSVKQLVLSHVLCRLFSMNNVIWALDKLVKIISIFIKNKIICSRSNLFKKSY
jgi:hypothetical protein